MCQEGPVQPEGWISVSEAAEQLGVSAAQVRDLVAAGRLAAVKPSRELLINADSVRRRLHVELPRAGQPWSPRMAWAVLAIASGMWPDWISSAERVRARRYVNRGLEQWPRLLARRADAHRARFLPAVRRRVDGMQGVAVSGAKAASHHGAGLVVPDDMPVDLVVSADAFDSIRRMRGINWDSRDPNVTLRVLPADLPPSAVAAVFRSRHVPKAVAAVDLLDLGDERSCGAAAELLAEYR